MEHGKSTSALQENYVGVKHINSVGGASVDEQDTDAMLEAIFSGDDSSQPIQDYMVFECQNPNWRVSRDELKKLLQIVLSFPSKSTIFMAIWRDGDVLRFSADNRDAYLDASLPLLSAPAYETARVYYVDTVKLYAFLNSYSQFALSFDGEGGIYYESTYARYKLDTINGSGKNYPDLPDLKWIKFPLSSQELVVFKNLYNFAVKLSDSRLLINKDRVEAFYTLYKFVVLNGSDVNENVVIRRLDLPVLKEIVDADLQFAYTKERLFFQFGRGIVSFMRVPYDEEAFMYPPTFLTGKPLGGFELDVPLVKRALKLSSLFNVSEVTFCQSELDTYMKVSDKAKFKVGSSKDKETLMREPFMIGVETFSNLLSTVSGSSLDVTVSEHGLQLTAGVNSNNVYSMSRASMSQVKQGNVPSLTSPVPAPTQVPPMRVAPPGTAPTDFQDPEVV